MIIFNLDEVLADCEHRRHFIDRYHPINEKRRLSEILLVSTPDPDPNQYIWRPDYKAYDEACDKDKPIEPVLCTFLHLTQGEPFNHDVQIWTGRCESVREKTLNWLVNLTGYCEDNQYWDRRLKMRPIGNNEPECDLKNRWLNEYMSDLYPKLEKCGSHAMDGFIYKRKDPIQMVFESQPDCIHMFRRHGIFVFDCRQNS